MARPPQLYRYCPLCAEELQLRRTGGRKRPTCPGCGFVHYLNPTVGVAVIAFDGDGLILVQSAQQGYLHGQWCIPCGHVEYDERLREAARREYAEETGLEVEVGQVYHVDTNQFHPWGHNSVGIWFEGEITGGTLQAGSDALSVAPFPLTDLPPRICYKSDMRVLRRLCATRGLPEPDLA